ncbi:MAG: UpxY family transcription antiterminator [Mangrovibacterium sp.]
MKKWYVVYVKSRAEKKVLQSLTGKNIEAWLPVQNKLRQWSDRKKLVEMPLFPGYLFVRVGRKEYDPVLRTENVVGYITFEGKAVPVSDRDIRALKQILQQDQIKVELTRDDLAPGELVEVLSGPLMGIQGRLIKLKGKHKVGIRIQQVQYIVMVEVPVKELAIIGKAPHAKKACA